MTVEEFIATDAHPIGIKRRIYIVKRYGTEVRDWKDVLDRINATYRSHRDYLFPFRQDHANIEPYIDMLFELIWRDMMQKEPA